MRGGFDEVLVSNEGETSKLEVTAVVGFDVAIDIVLLVGRAIVLVSAAITVDNDCVLDTSLVVADVVYRVVVEAVGVVTIRLVVNSELEVRESVFRDKDVVMVASVVKVDDITKVGSDVVYVVYVVVVVLKLYVDAKKVRLSIIPVRRVSPGLLIVCVVTLEV
jgi:hypothetical protein